LMPMLKRARPPRELQARRRAIAESHAAVPQNESERLGARAQDFGIRNCSEITMLFLAGWSHHFGPSKAKATFRRISRAPVGLEWPGSIQIRRRQYSNPVCKGRRGRPFGIFPTTSLSHHCSSARPTGGRLKKSDRDSNMAPPPLRRPVPDAIALAGNACRPARKLQKWGLNWK